MSNRRQVTVNAFGIGVATGAYGISFGAIAIASGLSPWQTQLLSLGMFTGASQFALVGVLGAGGGAIAAVLTAFLIGTRNGLYSMHVAQSLQFHGWRVPVAAQLTIDESTAMAMAQPDRPLARHAFWATGVAVFICWNVGTALGWLGASFIGDPRTLGLDAAIPAGFIALLWPRLRGRLPITVAIVGACLALALVPVAPAGVPILASSLVAVTCGLLSRETR
ncbi:MAG: AzlC family ABC transporter permease [Actinomycetales bacterium]